MPNVEIELARDKYQF